MVDPKNLFINVTSKHNRFASIYFHSPSNSAGLYSNHCSRMKKITLNINMNHTWQHLQLWPLKISAFVCMIKTTPNHAFKCIRNLLGRYVNLRGQQNSRHIYFMLCYKKTVKERSWKHVQSRKSPTVKSHRSNA